MVDSVKMCPKCGGPIPNADQPGAYPGALSRVDNKTEICSRCGMVEAVGEELTAHIEKSFASPAVRHLLG